MTNPCSQPTVLVVGSGITGLMTAYYAALAGYSVRLISKSPDPRGATAGTRFESSTWDGYINRYITLTEGHPHFDLPSPIPSRYPSRVRDFQQDISQGGMLVHPLPQWQNLTQQFLQERDRANQDQNAIVHLYHEYLDENRASMECWYELLTEIVLRHPHLVATLSLHTHGIDRFYDEKALFLDAAATQFEQNIVKQCYSPQQLLEHPDFQIYAPGIERGQFIAGGGLTMYGLAVDIQALCRDWLLQELEAQGVDMRLGKAYDVIGLETNAAGAVVGVRTQNGEQHSAKHLFLHPGAYMHPAVLQGTAAYGKLAGVKGLWMRIKNAQTLFGDAPRPNKIHGGRYRVQLGNRTFTGQICDLNVMPKHQADGSWDLVIGSGYLFVGLYPFEGDGRMGVPLPDAIAEADRQTQIQLAEELAMRAFAQVVSRVYHLEIDMDAVLAGTDPQIDLPSLGCVRSWTPDDRELRVLLPTEQGGVTIVDGGGNTGSTTKAPFISKAAVRFAQWIDTAPPTATSPSVELDRLDLTDRYEHIRATLRRTKEEVPTSRWQQLEAALNEAVEAAQLAHYSRTEAGRRMG